ncbi:MAG: pilus assembly protein N-terminal domain-containing protein, partial [Acidobacteriota bacterium]
MTKAAGLALVITALIGAQTAPVHRSLTLTTGRGELLQFASDVKQVAAAEPKIADVVVISPREVMVNAKEAGKTTIVIWEGTSPFRYDVDVVADNT